MRVSRVRVLLLVLVILGLMLPLGSVGWAQSATATPMPDTEEEAATPEEATATATPEEDVEVTPTVDETEATETPEGEDILDEDEEDAADEPETEDTPEAETSADDGEDTADAEPSEVVESEAEAMPEEPEALTDEAQSIELTVYNQNLGLVKEVRNVSLLEGENEVRFTDVPSGIDPTSVQVVSLTDPDGISLLEQNYEYDLVSTRQLLAKYLDREIRLATGTGAVYTGTLLSGTDDVILATDSGIVVVKHDQIQEFAFTELPEGLITRPTLVWLIQATEAITSDLQVTYLTNGIGWRADYVAMLNADESALSLNGWVTVDNQSGASYENAKLKLVAGEINRVIEPEPVYRLAESYASARAVPAVEEREFFEYHIYQVQRPVTVSDRQTKQIEFISAPQITSTKTFVFEAAPWVDPRTGVIITEPAYALGADTPVKVMLSFANEEGAGLGVPLPEGVIRVYKEDIDGSAQFVGEDSVDHTPKDESVSLYLGNAFDIVGERKQVSFEQVAERVIEEGIEITIRNHKPEDVAVEVIEYLFRAQDATLLSSTMDAEMLAPTTAKFVVDVEADGEATVAYTVRYEW